MRNQGRGRAKTGIASNEESPVRSLRTKGTSMEDQKRVVPSVEGEHLAGLLNMCSKMVKLGYETAKGRGKNGSSR